MYGKDLAYVHDEGFGELAEAAAREALRRYPLYVLDVGCGGGIMLERMLERGAKGHGIDVSPAMVRRAQARGVPASQGSWTQVDIPAGCLVTAIGEVLAYEVPNHTREMAAFFRQVHRAGASLMFDVPSPGRGDAPPHERAGDGWTVQAQAVEDGNTLVRTITVDRGEGPVQEVHRLRMFDADSMCSMLEAAGFMVEELGAYDTYILQDGWDAYFAAPA